jgi:hypothetical protein
MTCSPARLAANRANARLSTGPKTDEGKRRSRVNALKHGLAAEVVVPFEDVDAVAERFAEFEEDLKPSGGVARFLAHRAALLSVRLERSARHEAATITRQVRDAEEAHDERRRADAEAMAARLAADPANVVRQLRTMPEGIDWLIRAWALVNKDLMRPGRMIWAIHPLDRIARLMGGTPEESSFKAIAPLCRAICGDSSGLAPDQGAGLAEPELVAWARAQVGSMIDAEIAALRDLRADFDADAIAAERAEAGRRALFDPSKEATLARKYEAAAERGLYRALRELHAVEAPAEAVAEGQDAIEPAPPPLPLASFIPPDPEPAPEPAEPIAARPPRPRRPIGPEERSRSPQSPRNSAHATGATRATSSGWAQTSTSAS